MITSFNGLFLNAVGLDTSELNAQLKTPNAGTILELFGWGFQTALHFKILILRSNPALIQLETLESGRSSFKYHAELLFL